MFECVYVVLIPTAQKELFLSSPLKAATVAWRVSMETPLNPLASTLILTARSMRVLSGLRGLPTPIDTHTHARIQTYTRTHTHINTHAYRHKSARTHIQTYTHTYWQRCPNANTCSTTKIFSCYNNLQVRDQKLMNYQHCETGSGYPEVA